MADAVLLSLVEPTTRRTLMVRVPAKRLDDAMLHDSLTLAQLVRKLVKAMQRSLSSSEHQPPRSAAELLALDLLAEMRLVQPAPSAAATAAQSDERDVRLKRYLRKIIGMLDRTELAQWSDSDDFPSADDRPLLLYALGGDAADLGANELTPHLKRLRNWTLRGAAAAEIDIARRYLAVKTVFEDDAE